MNKRNADFEAELRHEQSDYRSREVQCDVQLDFSFKDYMKAMKT